MQRFGTPLYAALGTLLLVGIVYVSWEMRAHPPLDMSDDAADALSFDATSSWDPDLYLISQAVVHTGADLSSVGIPSPSKNSSWATRGDIGEMLQMKNEERSPATLEAIDLEQDIETATFVDGTIAELLAGTKYPLTARALGYAWGDLSVVIMQNKRHYNRVRPHELKEELAPTIEVPQHPAYPSGHATQSMFLALVMSEVNPSGRDQYMARAYEIAHHREVAGVHYPSDSRAGQELAQKFFNALMNGDPMFKELIENAKADFAQTSSK